MKQTPDQTDPEFDAHAEIHRLRARVARLTEALERVDRETQNTPLLTDGAIKMVRQALRATAGESEEQSGLVDLCPPRNASPLATFATAGQPAPQPEASPGRAARNAQRAIVTIDYHYQQALERVAEAAEGVGMNWKTGAPYGMDALNEALADLRRARENGGGK